MEKVTYEEEFDLVVGYDHKKPIAWGICRNDMGLLDTSKVLQSTYIITSIYDNDTDILKLLTLASLDENMKIKNLSSSENEFIVDIDVDFINKVLKYADELSDSTGIENDVYSVIGGIKYVRDQIIEAENEDMFGSGKYTYRYVGIYSDAPVTEPEVAYLKLTLLSEDKVPLRSLVLDGVFGSLNNVAWSVDGGPIEIDLLKMEGPSLKIAGQYPAITHVDKFPRMLSHIMTDESIRILDTSKVRLGAQLASGTTVMPGASYINFNSGTEGPVMVEGRISSSAVVGEGSDIGGGASILGVLSGTDGDPITIGKKCLLGANSVCGISLGDGCIIDAGVAILPGTKVMLNTTTQYNEEDWSSDTEKVIYELMEGNNLDPEDIEVDSWADKCFNGVVRADVLSGLNGLHFRQLSYDGTIIVTRSNREVVLNKELH